jgi:hypothetical protein
MLNKGTDSDDDDSKLSTLDSEDECLTVLEEEKLHMDDELLENEDKDFIKEEDVEMTEVGVVKKDDVEVTDVVQEDVTCAGEVLGRDAAVQQKVVIGQMVDKVLALLL